MTYEHFKDLARSATADKTSHYKEFQIGKNPRYGGHQRGLASMV